MNSPTSTAPDPFELLSSMRSPDIDRYLEPGDDPTADALLASILAAGLVPSGPGLPFRSDSAHVYLRVRLSLSRPGFLIRSRSIFPRIGMG